MFESLLQSLNPILQRLRGKGSLTEANTREALREVRTALLEADVNYQVVRDFTKNVLDRALGQEVIRSVSPGQQIIKIFYDELVKLMGPVDGGISFRLDGVTTIMLVGLQGSGKTTTAGKLARRIQSMGKRPLLVAADVQRPAAIEQVRVLGQQLNIPVYAEENGRPPRICRRAIEHAAQNKLDVAILDTAGRLHIDDALMAELRDITAEVKPDQTYFVCDAMTGQDAVSSAGEFNRQLAIDGVILTKLDGDARGGAALSVKAVTGKPIKFVGVGEHLDRIEDFVPERMASRILGFGDVVTLVERAQEAIEEEKALELQQKIRKATLTLEDFRDQLQRVRKMGPLKELMALMPGMSGMEMEGADEELPRIEAIISSMTPAERNDPEIVDASRRKRIAAGSGVEPADVNQLLKQFKHMRKMLKQISGGRGARPAAGLPGRQAGGVALMAPSRPGALRMPRHGKKHR